MPAKINKASRATRIKNAAKKTRAEDIRKAKLVKTHKKQAINNNKKKKK